MTGRTAQISDGESVPVAGHVRTRGLIANLSASIRRRLPFADHTPANAVTPREAVTAFLGTMASNAARGAVVWCKLLETGLEESGLDFDARHAFFATHPVDDYFFAGIVAVEAARIRSSYSSEQADALLGQIGIQVDRAAARGDRVISDLVFDIIGRIDLSLAPALQKMPYDVATKAILRQLDLHRNEATSELMDDKGFRHTLGEPLAIGFQNWWHAFRERFVMNIAADDEDEPAQETAPTVARRRRQRRVVNFI